MGRETIELNGLYRLTKKEIKRAVELLLEVYSKDPVILLIFKDDDAR